jgi:hypothetical protein
LHTVGKVDKIVVIDVYKTKRYGTVLMVTGMREKYENLQFFAVLRIRIRDLGSGAFLTLGSRIRIRFFRILDLGSLIPDTGELGDIFLSKKFYNSLKIGPKFFSSAFQK